MVRAEDSCRERCPPMLSCPGDIKVPYMVCGKATLRPTLALDSRLLTLSTSGAGLSPRVPAILESGVSGRHFHPQSY